MNEGHPHPRRTWRAEEKIRILTEGRQSGQSISEVCRRYQISNGMFYAWEKLARKGALQNLASDKPGHRKNGAEVKLREEVQRLRGVDIAEITNENL